MCSLFYSLVSLLVTYNSRSWNRCPQRPSRPRMHTLFHDLFPPISWTTFPYRSRYLGYTMPFFSVLHLLGLKSLNDRGSSLRPPLGCHLPRPSLLRPCRPVHCPLPTAHCLPLPTTWPSRTATWPGTCPLNRRERAGSDVRSVRSACSTPV